MKPATVRFYFDADIMGLGKLIAQLRNDCTYPGDPGAQIHRRERPPCVITSTATPDEEWIPQVTAQGLVIITRDSRIGRRPAEVNAVRDHGARLVALAGKEAVNRWAQLEALMCKWRKIEDVVTLPGPFMYRVTRTKFDKVL